VSFVADGLMFFSACLLSLPRIAAGLVAFSAASELSAYAASKGALTSLTQSFSTEMSKKGIRANVISPGFTKSSFYKDFKKNKKNLYKWTIIKTALGRWGETNEISNLILFLLSEKSSYITGENIKIDGGWRI